MIVTGIDIGMDNVGLCTCVFNDTTSEVDVADIKTVVSKPGTFIVPSYYDVSVLKFDYMVESVLNYVNNHNVDVVIIEQPFFDQLHARAVLRLYRLFWKIIDALASQYPSITVRSITAPKVRAYIGYNRKLGKTVKDAVSIALKKLPVCAQLIIDDHTEHALDALAISLAYISHISGLDLHGDSLKCPKK